MAHPESDAVLLLTLPKYQQLTMITEAYIAKGSHLVSSFLVVFHLFECAANVQKSAKRTKH